MDTRFLALLRLHDACHGLTDQDVNTIAQQGEMIEFKPGEVVHSAEQNLEHLHLVIQGRLKMTMRTPNGEKQTLRYVAAGDQFGALMLINDGNFSCDVVADESTVVLRMPRKAIEEAVDEYPVFRRNLLRNLGANLTDSIARRKRKASKLVAFIHADDYTRRLVAQVVSRLTDVGEKVGVFCDSNAPPYDTSKILFKSLRERGGEYVNEVDVRNVVAEWPHTDRILLVVDRLHPAEKLLRLVELVDSVYFLSTTDDPGPTVNELSGLMAHTPSWKNKTHFVWVLNEREQVAPYVPDLEKLVTRDFKVQIPSNETTTRLQTQGIERIVHFLRNVSIGVALSGGAARGMAHLGVLKALEDAGITVDRLAGTSAGVLTGLIYCAGHSPDFGIESFTKELEPGSIYKKLPKGDSIYMVAQFRHKTWDGMLRRYVYDWRLEQCPIPISTVTTDLISARSIVRTTGDGVHALLESINLPVISQPICRDQMMLVDGGVLNNLPADVLVKQGCNIIIGVDVSANIEHRVGNYGPETPTEEMRPPNAVATLVRCLNVQAHNLSGLGAKDADVIIAPDVSQFDSAAFSQTPEMAEIGYQAAMESVSRIRDILNSLDSDLFSPPT